VRVGLRIEVGRRSRHEKVEGVGLKRRKKKKKKIKDGLVKSLKRGREERERGREGKKN
jgi:hypothetical protein